MNTPAFVMAIIALVLCIIGIIGNIGLYKYNPQIKHIVWIIILSICICSNCYVIISNLLRLLF